MEQCIARGKIEHTKTENFDVASLPAISKKKLIREDNNG